jgi:hypothetical protein
MALLLSQAPPRRQCLWRRVAARARYEELATQMAAISSEMDSLRAEIQRGV